MDWHNGRKTITYGSHWYHLPEYMDFDFSFKVQPQWYCLPSENPYNQSTNFYRVPKLLLFKQKDSDPLLMTIINKHNTFIACPWALWINDLDRHPTCHIPLMTRIPDMTFNNSWRASSCSDITGGFVQASNADAAAARPPVPCLPAATIALASFGDALPRSKLYSGFSYFSHVFIHSLIIEKYGLQERKHWNLPRISCGANTCYWEQRGRAIKTAR